MIDPSLAASAALGATNLLTSAMSAGSETPEPKPNDIVNQADFMKLLVAQLQNQDPLNPLDSANFSAQLAQFSSLEQLTQINTKLADLAGPAETPLDAVSFLGRDVRAASDAIKVTGGVASPLEFDLAAAGVVQARILDGSGREVASLSLGTLAAGSHQFDLGAIAGAPSLADGDYHVRLSIPGDNGAGAPIATTGQGRVTGVDLAASPPVLIVDGRRIAVTDVREVREPTAATPAA